MAKAHGHGHHAHARGKDSNFDELACTYAALILVDDDVPITAEKINTVLKSANIDVEPIWPSLFARALSGIGVKSFITNVAVSAGSSTVPATASANAAVAATASAAPSGGASKESKKEAEEKKKEESESEDEEGMFDLFNA